MLSRLVSIAGLLCLAAGVAFMYTTGPDGVTLFRWERLLGAVAACMACFVVAAKLHK